MNDPLEQIKTFFRPIAQRDLVEVGLLPFLFLLLVAGAAAMFVALLYRWFYSSRSTGSEIYRSFPLLGISITAIFVSIQFSLPLSLGLLGALSIVRFRTPVKEPEEIGFLMLVIATSLACATFSLGLLGVILVAAILVLVAKHGFTPVFPTRSASGMLMLSLPNQDYRENGEAIVKLLAREARGRVESVSQLDDETVIACRFRGLPPERFPQLESSLRDLTPEMRASFVLSGG